VLKPNGIYLSVEMSRKDSTEDLDFLADLIRTGKITAVIDPRYPMEQIADAHRYVETLHKRGNVVLTWMKT
jgi:NADPH:quinone reductase-like Zn-dependent oxidoreductase